MLHRKSRALVLLAVLSALGLGALLADDGPGAQANPDPTITVNSTADTNARDSVMTLREAMLLVIGDDAALHMPGLTPAECGQISTAFYDSLLGCLSVEPPGSTSADTIVFDTVLFDPQETTPINLTSALPILNTGNDTIDGSTTGEVVRGVNGGFDCLTITSDGNTIKGLQILDCSYGVTVAGNTNIIGGSGPAERNVISDSLFSGIYVRGDGNTVKGNYIGTNAAGTAAMPNESGVVIDAGASNNTIGGSSATERNVISGNLNYGVVIQATGTMTNRIVGNYIGTNAAGTAAIPNSGGVAISANAQYNTIGGIAAGEGNIIAFNTGHGVEVVGPSTTGNLIRGNSIHSNGSTGIDTFNGGNGEPPPPVITGTGPVTGTVACASFNCTIDIYSDDEDEGRVYEGSTIADDADNWIFDGPLQGPNVTAIAIYPAGNTSEFSAPVEVTEPTPTPTPTPTPSPTATPGATPTPAGATRTLQWQPGWNNATWSGPGGAAPQDAFPCADGSYAAAYRYVQGGLERFFPDRPDISNMGPLAQYDAFLILITEPVTCVMPVTAASGTSRTLHWGAGWNNAGWSGADGTAPQDAFACADGSYAAAYRYVAGGLERFFPGRADISNMAPLNKYDAFLILLTAPVSCTMPIGP